MMRHVSVFRVKPEYRDPETIQMLEDTLKALPERLPTVTSCEIGVKPFPLPTGSPDGAVLFYDLIQILTFETPEDCAGYPKTEGHLDFLSFSSPYMEQVAAIDYPV